MSVLLAIFVAAVVRSTIGPHFFALAFLHVVHPVTGIPASVNMSVLAKPVGLILKELADVDVTFSVPESTLPAGFVLVPLALVDSSIGPFLNAISLAIFLAILLRSVY